MSCACNNQSRFLYELGNCDPVAEMGRAPDSLNTTICLRCGPDRATVYPLRCVAHVEFHETAWDGSTIVRGSLVETKFASPLSVRRALIEHGPVCDLVAEYQPDETGVASPIMLYRLKNCRFTMADMRLDSEDIVFQAHYTFTAAELIEGVPTP